MLFKLIIGTVCVIILLMFVGIEYIFHKEKVKEWKEIEW